MKLIHGAWISLGLAAIWCSPVASSPYEKMPSKNPQKDFRIEKVFFLPKERAPDQTQHPITPKPAPVSTPQSPALVLTQEQPRAQKDDDFENLFGSGGLFGSPSPEPAPEPPPQTIAQEQPQKKEEGGLEDLFGSGGLFGSPPPEPAPKSSPQPAPAEKKQPSGGLFGILEESGVIDKKTSRIIRGTGSALRAMQPIAYEEERTIGGSLALEVLNRFGGMYPNEKLQRYVTLVGESVASVSDRADIPYHFAVINSEEPNAFATPGGYVFVSVGLLKIVRNEAELAGVLGHEIAHITHRHALQTLERSKTLKGLTSLTTAILDEDPSKFNQIIDQVSEVLFTHGLDKELEYEADRLGMEYAHRVGYHSGGLLNFLKILGKGRSHDSIFFSTHPTPKDRFIHLYKMKKELSGQVSPAVLSKRYTARTRGLLP